MKIRTGFVSNSSSSSFAMICNKIDIKKVKVSDLKKKRIIIDTGKNYEGTVYAEIKDKELLNYYKNKDHEEAYECYTDTDKDWGNKIKKENLPEEFILLADEIDQTIIDTIEAAKELDEYGDY